MESRAISRRRVVGGIGASSLAFALGRTLTVSAQDDATPMADGAIVITGADFSFDLPGEVPAGFVTLTFNNEGHEDHHAQLAQINEGVTFDDVMATLEANDEPTLFSQITFVGGPGTVGPGGSQTVVQQLTPGSHFAICFIAGEDGIPHFAKGMIQPFEVVDSGSTGEEPTADGEVILRDFEFEGVPTEFPAGPVTWKVTNEGPEPHEMGILRLADGVSIDMAIGMIMDMGEEATPEAMMEGEEMTDEAATPEAMAEGEEMAGPPITAAGGIQGMATGQSGWLMLDLEPADYLAVCFIPSPANEGTPHVMLGMIQGFTVTDA